MREKRITIAIIGAVMFLLCIYLFVFEVRTNQVVVHYRPRGRVFRVLNAEDEKDESGLYFQLPWPFDKVVKYDKRLRVLDGRLPQTQLSDEWQVIIQMYASWRITDPVAFEEKLEGSQTKAEERLKDLMHDETAKVIGKHTFGDLVNTDKEKLRFEQIERDIAGRVGQALEEEGCGIALAALGIRRIAMPDGTIQAVFDRMKEERKAVANESRAAGKSRRDKIIAEATEKADGILTDARALATTTRSEGEAEEAKYYDVFATSSDLAIFLWKLESLQRIAQQARESGNPITYVLDTMTQPLDVLREDPGQGIHFPRGPTEQATEAAGEQSEDKLEQQAPPADTAPDTAPAPTTSKKGE